MGSCVSCDFTDIWMGDVTEKHVTTNPVQTLKFILYRDDAWDILVQKEEQRIFIDHLQNLHPNLTWTVETGSEGGYLDLWITIEDGRIHWRNFCFHYV